MARVLRPQRSSPATQNDIRRAISSVDALIVSVEELREWQDAVAKYLQEGDTNLKSNAEQVSETLTIFEKHFEKLFERINKMDAKIKELDRQTSRLVAASMKTSQPGNGKKKEVSKEEPNTSDEPKQLLTEELDSDNQETRIEH